MTEAERPAADGGTPPRPPRLRFAPSPAGDLHVGHVRHAALTWVLSRRVGGRYFVRFENTDDTKEVPGARRSILDDLAWLGLAGDGPAADQSAMTVSYRGAVDRLAEAGWTYPDGAAVRFRIPTHGAVGWRDLARGDVTVGNADLHDPVLVRSAGTPTFFLASTVDDIDDHVTHFLRPETAMRLTATQMHIWRALGVEPPAAGHLPLVTKGDGGPVRFGDTAYSVGALRRQGIPPEALAVYLAMPQTASWARPPCSLAGVVDRIDVGRLPRRPTRFDPAALAALVRRWRRQYG